MYPELGNQSVWGAHWQIYKNSFCIKMEWSTQSNIKVGKIVIFNWDQGLGFRRVCLFTHSFFHKSEDEFQMLWTKTQSVSKLKRWYLSSFTTFSFFFPRKQLAKTDIIETLSHSNNILAKNILPSTSCLSDAFIWHVFTFLICSGNVLKYKT